MILGANIVLDLTSPIGKVGPEIRPTYDVAGWFEDVQNFLSLEVDKLLAQFLSILLHMHAEALHDTSPDVVR